LNIRSNGNSFCWDFVLTYLNREMHVIRTQTIIYCVQPGSSVTL